MGILIQNILSKFNINKVWKAEYYLYNLTQKIEKSFYTELGAVLYGLYVGKYLGFRTRVLKLDDYGTEME